MSITVEQMVNREVICCMSSIVSPLAQGNGLPRDACGHELSDLAEQAFELSCPIPDCEEAARQAGWTVENEMFVAHGKETTAIASPLDAGGWEDLCSEYLIDPYEWEVYEHWAVSPWLADKLIEQGQKVDKDFGGLCVWARTTTGQAIAADGVIQRIYDAMMKA